ncbi:hypoxanthine phosphoribosyltransferase [Methanohalophilus levihalophilus]|uniref:phosphoribosyltransferase n=1 Tax=Methanohalophilus levihalophilus TaxID=1431282 RepID=UPI001AEAD401|nr:phosphoribosyltransferase [Methanohalophilus levihalophilus]MBP2029294.1 hypoxanthine phosphoribosyltransferase [Methanohalophilus levihalophilus]
MALPDNFKCVVTNWDYIYNLCRNVADDVKEDGYEPDIIIALARGGWFAGRVLCDFLNLDDLTSLKIEHYIGAAEHGDEPHIKYPLADKVAAGKNVLLVDDITDTGQSMKHAKEYVLQQEPKEVRTATLQFLYNSIFEPDYCGEKVDEWAWIVYPWNFIEDLTDIISGLMQKDTEHDVWDIPTIKHVLWKNHSIEPMYFEMTQPGRMTEILKEMERRDIVEKVEKGEGLWKKL